MDICVDFDGVLHLYTEFKGQDVFGDPVPGAAKALKYLHNQGHTLILHTTRPITVPLVKWLELHEMHIDHYNENPNMTATGQTDPRKPIAKLYIDDRALRFRGNWDETIFQVDHFRTWWEE